jgi:hypothetical protein
MIKLMIVILYNIVYFYIGRTRWKVGKDLNNIRYGLMVAIPNSKAKFHYILWVVTFI